MHLVFIAKLNQPLPITLDPAKILPPEVIRWGCGQMDGSCSNVLFVLFYCFELKNKILLHILNDTLVSSLVFCHGEENRQPC